MDAINRTTGVAGLVSLLAVVAAASDPDLEPGFPVQAYHGGGSYHAGPAIHTLVAQLDGDPQLEIVTTGLATGPLHAWNHDGTILAGWPAGVGGAGYVGAGNLSNGDAGLEVFGGFWGTPGGLIALAGDASFLPGWPKSSSNFVTTPPALADVDGDGIDEIFLGEEDWKVHAYRADGSVLPGWPASGSGGQEKHTPAIADLDGDGDLEILSASGWTTPGVYLQGYHHDGTAIAGFPVLFPGGHVDTFPVVGDVDGDGEPEIVVMTRLSSYPWSCVVNVLSADGTTDWTKVLGDSVPYGTAPALADLDGDAIPEIVVQLEGALEVVRGDASSPPGWPVVWSTSHWLGNSSPVVGDVDGDASPEIVVTSQPAGSSTGGEVRVYRSDGTLHPSFPKALPLGSGAVPAIADLDLDGRNEIVVTGSYWSGISGSYDKVWAFDLGGPAHGRIEWAQLGGGPRHQGVYRGITSPGRGFCFGDPGSGTPCPCSNDNDGTLPGSGCDNGVFASGARLTGSGTASVSNDTLVLTAEHLEPLNSGLYFQAEGDLSPGIAWGDGLRCAGGNLKRLEVRFADVSGSSQTTLSISARAGNVTAGSIKRYQCWYRTTANPPCGGGVNDFNATNGYEVVWVP